MPKMRSHKLLRSPSLRLVAYTPHYLEVLLRNDSNSKLDFVSGHFTARAGRISAPNTFLKTYTARARLFSNDEFVVASLIAFPNQYEPSIERTLAAIRAHISENQVMYVCQLHGRLGEVLWALDADPKPQLWQKVSSDH